MRAEAALSWASFRRRAPARAERTRSTTAGRGATPPRRSLQQRTSPPDGDGRSAAHCSRSTVRSWNRRALDLDDHPEATVDEIDPADPTLTVTELDLPLERRITGPLDDPLEPALEIALRGSIPVRSSEASLRIRLFPSARPRRQRGDEGGPWLASLSGSSRASGRKSAQPVRMHPAREVEQGAKRGRDRDPGQHAMMSDASRLTLLCIRPTSLVSDAVNEWSARAPARGRNRESATSGGRVESDGGAGDVERGRHESLLGRVSGSSDPQHHPVTAVRADPRQSLVAARRS